MLTGYPIFNSSNPEQIDFSARMQDQNNRIFNFFDLQRNNDPSLYLLNLYNTAFATAFQARLLFSLHPLTYRNQRNLNFTDASTVSSRPNVEQPTPANIPSYLSNNDHRCCACGTDRRSGVHMIPVDHDPYATSDNSASADFSGNIGNYSLDRNSARQKYVSRDRTNTLKVWMKKHIKYPYPTKEEKKMLASMSTLTLTKVTSWFIKTRYRWKKSKKLAWKSKYRYVNSSQETATKCKDADSDEGLKNACQLDAGPDEEGIAMSTDFSSNLNDAKPKIWSLANIATAELCSMPSQSCAGHFTDGTSEHHRNNSNNIQHPSNIVVSHTT